MKTIIAGSRGINDYDLLCMIIKWRDKPITEVVSGGAYGVDKMGEEWAYENKVPVKCFYPDWSIGKSAGPIRNRKMADYAEALIALWDGHSRGTANMIHEANKRGLDVWAFDSEGVLWDAQID